MSVLNRNISVFHGVKKTDPKKTVILLDWLTSDQHQEQIQRLRNLDTKAYKREKKKLPAITPSGTFSKRAESGLIEHSGFIQFDIDHPDDIQELKSAISAIPFVAYVSLSTSGRGLWGLIPIQHPEHHKSHFRALQCAFMDMGVTIDPAPSNVASLRFASYDPKPFINHSADPFPYLSEENTHPEQVESDTGPNKVLQCIQQIEEHQIDITRDYDQWFPIGSAFLAVFGDQGKEMFHRISRYSEKYNRDELEKHWQAWQRSGASADIGTFLNACKDHGIFYAPAKKAKANPAVKRDRALQPKYESQNPAPFGYNPYTGEIFDSRGYPASWDTVTLN